MKIIESSYFTVVLTHLNLSLLVLDIQFTMLWFVLYQELISLNVRLCTPNFVQRLGTVS